MKNLFHYGNNVTYKGSVTYKILEMALERQLIPNIKDTMEMHPDKERMDVFIYRPSLAGQALYEKLNHLVQNTIELYMEVPYLWYRDEDGDKIYLIPQNPSKIEDLVKNETLMDFLSGELSSDEGVQTPDGCIYWGVDVFDFLMIDLSQEEIDGIDEMIEEIKEEKRKAKPGNQ